MLGFGTSEGLLVEALIKAGSRLLCHVVVVCTACLGICRKVQL